MSNQRQAHAHDEDADHTRFTDLDTLPYTIALLNWVALVTYPLFIYSWYQLKKHQKQRYFQIRGIHLITLQTLIMFLHNGIAIPLEMLYDDLKIIPLPYNIGDIIEHMIDGSLFLALILIMLIRLWLVNYHHKLQLEIANSAWKQQLDSYSEHISFYCKYKSTLGSSSWLCKIIGSVYSIGWFTVIILDIWVFQNESYFTTITESGMGFGYIIAIICCIIMWCKFPKFKDNLFIRRELKESFIYLIFSLIIGVILWIITFVIPKTEPILQFALMFPVDGLCFLAVLRVIQLNRKLDKIKDVASELADNLDQYKEYFTLNQVLQHNDGYTEFMNFLVKEFATEHLCFATEYSQFRESLNLSEKQKISMGCNIIFKTAITSKRSHFKTSKNIDYDQFIAIITKLYHKYIAFDNATYGINISYEARLSLAALIDPKYKKYVQDNKSIDLELQRFEYNLPENDLFKTIQMIIPILEVMLLEITRLLQGSFMRFKRTSIWNELCSQLISEYANTPKWNDNKSKSKVESSSRRMDPRKSISTLIMFAQNNSNSIFTTTNLTELSASRNKAPVNVNDHGIFSPATPPGGNLEILEDADESINNETAYRTVLGHRVNSC